MLQIQDIASALTDAAEISDVLHVIFVFGSI